MSNVFQTSWFKSRPRTNLANYLSKELENMVMMSADYSIHNQDDKEVLYRQSVSNAMNTCLMFIKYLCVDNTIRKPWIARKPVKQILDFKEFKLYSDDVVTWLNTQPPSMNYSALVYTNTIIKFLTTMEFKDDTRGN